MTEQSQSVGEGIEAALRRAAERARRQAMVSGVPLVRSQNGKLIKVAIAPDGTETIVSEEPLRSSDADD